jgi:hypothetical protein
MKLAVAVFAAAVLAGGLASSAHAQIQVQVPGVGVTVGAPPPPAYGSSRPPGHCEELAQREEGLRQRVTYMRPGDERARLEGELRVVHEERERCSHR